MAIRYSDKVFSPSNLDEVGRLFTALYGLQPEYEDSEGNAYEPKAILFTPEAKAVWKTWYDDHCAETIRNDFPALLHGPWAKLRGYSVSITLILALTECPQALVVDQRAVLAALTIIEEYIKPHLRRLYPRMLSGKASPFERCRTAILKALRQPHTYRDLRQKIGGRYPGNQVRDVLADLKDSGHIAERKGTQPEMEFYLCDDNKDGGQEPL